MYECIYIYMGTCQSDPLGFLNKINKIYRGTHFAIFAVLAQVGQAQMGPFPNGPGPKWAEPTWAGPTWARPTWARIFIYINK